MSYRERRDGAYSQGGYREPAFQDAGRFRGPHFTSGGYAERQPISSKEVPAGVIFGCNNKTMMECMHRSLFGATMAQSNLVSRIVTGTTLFLFNFDTKNLHGIFEATSNGGIDLDRDAFKEHSPAGFPAQVWVRLRHDCTPLHESVFKQAIIENYYRQTKFNFELSLQQVHRLLDLYSQIHPTSAPPQQPYSPPEVAPGTEAFTPPHQTYAPAAYTPPQSAYVPEHYSWEAQNASASQPPRVEYYRVRPPGYTQQSYAYQTPAYNQTPQYSSWQSHPPYDPTQPSF